MNDFTQRGIFRWMTKLGSIVVLNLLWLLCCLPIVTIIPACVAMYDSAVCCLHGDEGSLCRHFFSIFKTELLRGIGMTVLWLVIAVMLFIGYRALSLMAGENTLLQIYTTVYAGSMLVPVAILAWLIPLEARSAQGIWKLHKAAMTRTIVHLPITAALLGIALLAALMLLVIPVPAIAVAFQSALAEKTLDRYILEDPN